MKIIIIGGGVAGMTAGIYAQKAGYESEIYEKNSVAGGQCMGWNRNGYHIDNCLHWLTGTRKGSSLRRVWEEINALTPEIEIIEQDRFFTSVHDGKEVTFWRDLRKTEREMIAIAPEDEEEIKKFIQCVKLSEPCEMPIEKPMDKMNIIDYIKLGKKMSGMAQVNKEYKGMDIEDLQKRFKSSHLRTAFSYMAKEFFAQSFIVSYATITGGNGDVPVGGSLAMANRIEEKYKMLGGKIHTNTEVNKICIEGKRATGILLKNGKFIKGDYIISAADTAESFYKLLGEEYMSKKWKKCYENREQYPVISSFQIAFGADKSLCDDIVSLFFDCEPLTVGKNKINRISLKNYSYDKCFAPENKCVLQTSVLQYEKDFEYWKSLSKEEYKKQKAYYTEEILKRILKQFPRLKENIEVLDCWTPATYEKYCNSYKGSYMSFVIKKSVKGFTDSGKIKGLRNVLLTSQWLQAPGGLPSAVASGKFVIGRIKNDV